MVYVARARLHRRRANVIQTLKTVEGLDKIGVGVRLFVPPWQGKESLEERLRYLGVLRRLDVCATPWLKSHWKAFHFAPFFWIYGRLLKTAASVYTRSVPISLSLTRRKIPHSLEIHDVAAIHRTGALEPVLAAYRRGVVRNLFSISRAAAQMLIEHGAEPTRIHVCPSGVDPAMFRKIQPFDPRRLKSPHIVYVGRISRDRGLDILERLSTLDCCRVTVVGELQDPPRHSPIQVVPFVSHRDIPKYLEEADILVMPYQRHLPHAASISPMKLFEAMAAGRPIIVSDLKPIREIIENGRNGLCVDPDDPEGWVAAVQSLRANPDLALRFSQTARNDAATYSWENRACTIRDVVLRNSGA
ncbi:Glycosyltransferase involved in cell wall bisynthesis [Desulfacinum hydrothermale DSM 13146]|uniref:Glycosyltransferase involved in cell wall bisynthesis n=1 Tax=Desulfacinum hydrothermale DSM 13146 TaxID=1121390 RepID=A0A1W1X197_9BACT|nr:Glycosyltransferase involved in cell wall bisynthesis [Desulfacinum hydrothermale DSM 13146]